MIRNAATRLKCKYLAGRRARQIVAAVEAMPDGPFSTPAPDGYLRGIDYYDREQLIKTIARVLCWYRRASGAFPDLIEPKSCTEKLNHAKFFAAMKVPETGNKSMTATFIPQHMKGEVHYPEIVWHSSDPALPDNDFLPPGLYYLKTNHGSGWVRRIEYPLSQAGKEALEREFAGFLATDFGTGMGEWWYNVFDRELLLEKAVCRSDPPTTLLFTVIGGEVVSISADRKSLEPGVPTRILSFDGEFRLRSLQRPYEEQIHDFDLSPELKEKTRQIAAAIGAQFDSIRVDLIVGDDGECTSTN